MVKRRIDATKIGCLLMVVGPVVPGVIWWLFPGSWFDGFWGGCLYFLFSAALPLYCFNQPPRDFYDDHHNNP